MISSSPFDTAFSKSPEVAVELLNAELGEFAPPAGKRRANKAGRASRRVSGGAAPAELPAAASGEVVEDSAAAPAPEAATEIADDRPVPQASAPAQARSRTRKSDAQAGESYRTSTSIPDDVWQTVVRYCLDNSVPRTQLLLRALANTKGEHADLVLRERGSDVAAADDAAVMEVFQLSELPPRRGATQPKKQLQYVVTPDISRAIDEMVDKAGARDRAELFTVTLREYLRRSSTD